MRTWPYIVHCTPTSEIAEAIANDTWQKFRLSLKGISTEDKLNRLYDYVTSRKERDEYARVEQIRIDNYINALLRGGQLIRVGGEIRVQR